MGGVSVEGGGGGKKSVNSEVNLVPMIDLLLCTISFLLITAVWSQMARINADAQVPGPPRTDQQIHKVEPEPQLHVTLGPTQEGQLQPRLESRRLSNQGREDRGPSGRREGHCEVPRALREDREPVE